MIKKVLEVLLKAMSLSIKAVDANAELLSHVT